MGAIQGEGGTSGSYCVHGVAPYARCLKCEHYRSVMRREELLYKTLEKLSLAVDHLSDTLRTKR